MKMDTKNINRLSKIQNQKQKIKKNPDQKCRKKLDSQNYKIKNKTPKTKVENFEFIFKIGLKKKKRRGKSRL